MSPIIREYEKRSPDYFILHSGQHYSNNLDKIFFEELKLPKADYNLDVGSGRQGEQTAKIITGIENILIHEKPDIILVQGDTNTVLAGALAAVKLKVKIGHIEAGLRSFDRSMPEETNRILTDHCSDYLFAPTEVSKKNLLNEGISANNIFVCGNTIVDAVHQNLVFSKSTRHTLDNMDLSVQKYFLLTVHRQENVDVQSRLTGIINGMKEIIEDFGLPILFPAHPRTLQKIDDYAIKIPKGLIIVDPIGYMDFLQLEEGARLVMTDSGGLQEECCVLHTPCITLRDNTERPETLDVGANILVGSNPDEILKGARIMVTKNNKWTNPFGDGKATDRIINILESVS